MERFASAYAAAAPATAEEEAYRHVLHGIRMGLMRPGDRLVPEDIASRIGMSRMPVREAFRRLASEGLLLIRPNRGVTVRGLTQEEMEEVFEMRAVLEGLAASRAAKNITPREIADLERQLDVMDRPDTSVSDWVTTHREFHERLCGLSRSPRLVGQISALHATIEPHMRIYLETADKPACSRDDHVDIIQALKAGRHKQIEALMRQHIRATIPVLKSSMSRLEVPRP
jgi:DNA-binding GntR family transcriptional regulator